MMRKFVLLMICIVILAGAVPAFPAALKEVRAKAKKGDLKAVCELADMYYDGREVRRNYEKAFELYAKAAKKGNAYAQYKVGFMYVRG